MWKKISFKNEKCCKALVYMRIEEDKTETIHIVKGPDSIVTKEEFSKIVDEMKKKLDKFVNDLEDKDKEELVCGEK